MTHAVPRPARPRHGPAALAALTVAAALLLAGCAAERVHSQAMTELRDGKAEAALANLRKASDLEPGNARYRIDYLSQRTLHSQALNARADDARSAGQLDAATGLYADVLRLDPANERAARGMQLIQVQRKADLVLVQADRALKAKQPEAARELLKQGQKDMPQNASIGRLLREVDERIDGERAARERQLAAQAAFKRPVTLQFREANLKMVFEALSRTANVNIILDREVKNDLKTTLYVKDASVEDTIDLILLQNQLEKRVLNNNTLFVYPATAPKQKEYNELKVRSFQLSNVESAYVANILKTLLKTKDIVTDAKTNTLVMRDTPEAIAVAEKIVAANDLPDPEVMLEVEVLEVSSDRLANLGIKWPDTFGISTPKSAGTVGDLRALTRNDLLVTPLAVSLNLMLQDTDTNILASPRIRTRNKEKARILVGDKLPQITNLISPQQSGQNSVVTGSIQYVDVGIKLEVEAQVYADNDVGIKLNLEVSNVTDTLQTESGRAYQIGTRSAQTTLRLRDGETQVLAGLISDSDRSSAQKVPGLGQMPMVGRLFSSHSGNLKKTEIVLSITPRIIRPQTLQDLRNADAWSGSEATLRDRQLRIDAVGALRAEQTKPDPNAARVASPAAGPTGRAPLQRPSAPPPAPTAPAEVNDVPPETGSATRPAAAPRASPVTLPPSATARPATSGPGGNPPAPEAEVAAPPAAPASAPGA